MENLFRKEVVENRRYRLKGSISLIHPPKYRNLTILILIIVIICLIFLFSGTYTRKERAIGVLQPNTGWLKLSSPQSGVIDKLLVKEGEEVKKDSPLLAVKSEKHGANGFELNKSLIEQYHYQFNTSKNQLSQQKIQNKLELNELNNSYTNLIERLSQLSDKEKIFHERIEINKEITNKIKGLSNTGYISELELKKQDDNLLSLKQQLSSIYTEKLLLENDIKKVEVQLIQIPIHHNELIEKLEVQLEENKVKLLAAKQLLLGELRSPIDGIVTGLLVHEGSTVYADQNVLTILPLGGEINAVIYVPTAAFGFIKTGQEIRIRYHAFPYEKFGLFKGTISEVSESVILPNETATPGLIIEPSYRIIVNLQDQKINAYGRQIGLRAGMTLDADIIIEKTLTNSLVI